MITIRYRKRSSHAMRAFEMLVMDPHPSASVSSNEVRSCFLFSMHVRCRPLNIESCVSSTYFRGLHPTLRVGGGQEIKSGDIRIRLRRLRYVVLSVFFLFFLFFGPWRRMAGRRSYFGV
jgi:hypothetical protein